MSQFSGIIPPLVTPLLSREELDVAGLNRLLDHVLDGGVHGLFVLGTTGEGPNLSYRLRHQLVEAVCEKVGDRVPVLVGITDSAFDESVELADHARAAGASAVVAASPPYFPLSGRELEDYFVRLADSVPLPVMLYNMPACTKGMLPLDLLKRLAGSDNIVGIKDSSGEMEYFTRLTELKQTRSDWSILMGPELLLADAVRAGGDGGICGGANVAPSLFVEWYSSLVERDDSRSEALQERARRLAAIYEVEGDLSKYIKGTKFAIEILGLCSAHLTEPFSAISTEERRHIHSVLEGLGLVESSTVWG